MKAIAFGLFLALAACTPQLQAVAHDAGGVPIYLKDDASRERWTPQVAAETMRITTECGEWFREREIPTYAWQYLRAEVTTDANDSRPHNAALLGRMIDIRWPTKYGATYIGQAICHELWHAFVGADYNHAVLKAAGYRW